MSKKLIAAVAIAVAAAALAGVATAGGGTARQAIAFSYANGDSGKMTLTPLAPGSVLADRGSTTWCCWIQKEVRRDGEQLDVSNPRGTFVGKRGTLAWRERITWFDLASGYSIATGTWTILHGTGAYKGLTGHGHLAFVSGPGDEVLSFRAVGLVA